MKLVNKIITAVIGFFIIIPGFAKFKDPFHSNFTTQIEKAGLPFPDLSFFMGQAGLLVTGVLLYSSLFFWKKIPDSNLKILFTVANVLVLPIMSVAFYVHMHPDVPAEVLPQGIKPPYMAVTLIILSILNVYLFHQGNVIEKYNSNSLHPVK